MNEAIYKLLGLPTPVAAPLPKAAQSSRTVGGDKSKGTPQPLHPSQIFPRPARQDQMYGIFFDRNHSNLFLDRHLQHTLLPAIRIALYYWVNKHKFLPFIIYFLCILPCIGNLIPEDLLPKRVNPRVITATAGA
ncbi:MAG: hypothetical protein JJU00_05290 [Opitutales bacterium]|nr:hypothetical protein [Opitutales bacterium]